MSEISLQVLIGISWTFTALAIVLTACRLWIRSKIIKRVSWDDAAHVLGLLFLVAQVSVVHVAACMLYQSLDHPAGDNSDYPAGHPLFIRLNTASTLLTWFCLYAIKLSFLLLYYHIFQVSRIFIRAWWMVLGTVVITFLISIAGTIIQCGSPLRLEDFGTCSWQFHIKSMTDSGQRLALLLYCCITRPFLSSTAAF